MYDSTERWYFFLEMIFFEGKKKTYILYPLSYFYIKKYVEGIAQFRFISCGQKIFISRLSAQFRFSKFEKIFEVIIIHKMIIIYQS